MPKIIENIRQTLISEAQKQVDESGYAAMTIRSVATACGVGVGTVYNYFSSKESLVAAFLLDDWKQCTAAIKNAACAQAHPRQVLECIYLQLHSFIDKHTALFSDAAAVASFSGSPSPYHSLLRRQLAAPLARFAKSDFEAEFIAEALLTWTVAGKGFEEIYTILEKLL